MFLAVILSTVFLNPGKSEDWSRWRGPDENGVARETLPPDFDAEALVWRAQVGVGFSSPVIVSGRLYTLGHDGSKPDGQETLWCLDAKTGEVVWSDSWPAPLLSNLHEGGPGATPTVANDRVFSLGKNGDLLCHEATSGKVMWKRDLLADTGMKKAPEWGFAGSPYLMEGQLIVEAGVTLSLDPKNGEILWRSQPFRPAYGTPVRFKVGEVERLAILKTDGLVILDPVNGGTVSFEPWETSFDTNATTPIVSGASIFVSTGYDRGCALFHFDGRTLNRRYENQSLCTHMNNAVLVDGHLYGFDGTAHRGRPTEFVCIEFESGKERWRVSPDEGLGCGSLISTSDGQLLILTEKGELVVAPASPEGFRMLSRAQVLGGRCWTPPSFADGLLYARNSRGDLVCVGRE
ncbi:MAG: PQQ-binding-like beta-propeller repeat protein [Verrucomicrobiae bacterium]|nr:PQQ-binding-like beta-propeller repeat protein [Verrucomicrobiae bacterium]